MFVDALLGKVGVGEASTVCARKRSHGLPSHEFFDGICVVVRKKTAPIQERCRESREPDSESSPGSTTHKLCDSGQNKEPI